ncbi:hypothetical protein ABEB36_007918 [Hypothenemus hampei]|uniref:CFAP74 fourth Ig-like domain-containing protein n=1 Tax=Hypothenemus hampei TaxID=57062 RepID=A0ABD1EVN9_HYPHA
MPVLINFVDDYAEESNEECKETIIDNALESIRKHEEESDYKLKAFIDDFIKSEEYQAYAKEKHRIQKKTKATQCELNEIIVECHHKEKIDKYPLTEERKKMYAFKLHFGKYLEKLKRKRAIEKQEQSVQIIKAKIQEARRIFEYTQEFRAKNKKNAERKILQKYSIKFDIDLTKLNDATKIKLLERFKKCDRMINERKQQTEKNMKKIIEKLINERKFEKAKDLKPVKRIRLWKELVIDDMEVKGTKIDLVPKKQLNVQAEIPVKVDETIIESINEPSKKQGKKKKKKKDKTKKKVKLNKAIRKTVKDKGKRKKLGNKLVLPKIPIINQRRRIFPENIGQLIDIIEEFRHFDGTMENEHMTHYSYKKLKRDTKILFRPQTVLFQNFEKNRCYTKIISITNISSRIKKVRFVRYQFPNEYDSVAFDLENFGILKLFTGCSIKFYLKFQPYDPTKSYSGLLEFLSYDTRLCEYYQFDIKLRCVPKYSQLKITPTMVNFGNIPIWKANDGHAKILKLENKGLKPCVVVIKKIFDPLGMDALLDEENKENNTPKSSCSSMNVAQDILEDCLLNSENNFQFENSYFSLGPLEEKRLKILFKNASYVGNYMEQFVADVYERFENILLLSGCQIISLHSEITGHFLTATPEFLDFGTCMLNSCYQMSFDLHNGSSSSQAVIIKIPSHLSEMIQSDISTIFMPSKSTRTIFLRFRPRNSIFQRYSDVNKSNCLLNFYVQICIASKLHQDVPPINLEVYAITDSFEDLTITCESTENLSNFLNTILIDLGDCSVYETIWTDIYLSNNTASTQFCGFVDLPQIVTLEPNLGFCKLHSGQRKKFKLYFSPEVKDFPNYPMGSLRNSIFFFKVKLETVASLGQLERQKTNNKEVSSEQFINEHTSLVDSDSDFEEKLTFNDVSESMMVYKHSNFFYRNSGRISNNPDSNIDTPLFYQTKKTKDVSDIDTVLNYRNFLIVETNSRREVWFKVNLRRPLLEFSHQFVEFPDTPPGSYSMMEVTLSALNREIDQLCNPMKNRLQYKAHFQFYGDSEEIQIEPGCGVLNSGQSIKITLLARPNIPKENIEKTAKQLKYEEILHRKKGKNLKKKNKGLTKTSHKKKMKKVKKNSDKDTKSTNEPTIAVKEDELTLNYLDLYPAEMVYWRSMEPYYIKATFVCLVEYETQKMHKKQDRLYLDAICKVTRPEFRLDLNQQRLDFGNCLIGSSITKIITIQNITYRNISPKFTLLNPFGSFPIPYIPDKLPPEHFLKIPLTFKPHNTEQVNEFVEISTSYTVIPLILCGKGWAPSLRITPEYGVFRLSVKGRGLGKLHLTIENTSEGQTRAEVRFEKLFEIEGTLKVIKEDKLEKVKTKKENKKKESKLRRKEQHSNTLSEKELESIKDFQKTKGDCHIDLKLPQNNTISIQSGSSHTVTLFYGTSEAIKKRKLERSKKKSKEKNSTAKSNVSSHKEDKDTKHYIAQYNIKVGDTFIKTLIVICSIKD